MSNNNSDFLNNFSAILFIGRLHVVFELNLDDFLLLELLQCVKKSFLVKLTMFAN